MHTEVILNKYKETDAGTELYITIPNKQLGEMFLNKRIKKAEIRFDDGRTISIE